MSLKHQNLLQEFEALLHSGPSTQRLLETVSNRLHGELARYNWVGFYLLDKDDPRFLNVGPFTGSFTPRERIPVDQGLCGAAITSGRTVIVNNVSSDPRYLAGSEMVKSEIVAPILARGKAVAEIDINSYFAETFTAEEQEFVETCAAMIGKYLEKQPQ